MKTSRTTCITWLGLAALLCSLLATAGCEDDPRDLDYLKDAGADAGD